jgi:hypothetical protein
MATRKIEQELFDKIKSTLLKYKPIEYQHAHDLKDGNELVYLANKALDLMQVREVPLNSNAGRDVSLIQDTVGGPDHSAWCVSQQQSCVAFAEKDLGITSKLYATESCADLRAHENGMKIPFENSKRGDLLIFKKPSGLGHIGCFVRWIDMMKSAVTLEGNTTSGKVGDKIVRDGGGSYQCERLMITDSMKLSMVIRAF